jgi:hypothetical protein
MKVKIFCRELSDDGGLESDINAFLADMPPGAVKYMTSDLVTPRTEEGETKLVITIWYDDVAPLSPDREARQPFSEDVSTVIESAAGFDAPERFPKIRS